MHPLIHVTFSSFNNLKSNIMNLLYHIHTYLSSYFRQHLANRSTSASSWGKTDPSLSFGSCCPLGFVCLFVLRVIYHTLNPPPLQLFQSLNTFIQVNTMDSRHNRYIHTHTQSTAFLLFLLLDLQAGQLAPYRCVENNYNELLVNEFIQGG
jgi:hypothetical protein